MCQKIANVSICLEAYESGRDESCQVAKGSDADPLEPGTY